MIPTTTHETRYELNRQFIANDKFDTVLVSMNYYKWQVCYDTCKHGLYCDNSYDDMYDNTLICGGPNATRLS